MVVIPLLTRLEALGPQEEIGRVVVCPDTEQGVMAAQGQEEGLLVHLLIMAVVLLNTHKHPTTTCR